MPGRRIFQTYYESEEDMFFSNVWFFISREWILLATFDASRRQANSNIFRYSIWKISKNSNFRQQITGQENVLFPTQGWLYQEMLCQQGVIKKSEGSPFANLRFAVGFNHWSSTDSTLYESTVLSVPTIYPTYIWYGRKACYCQHIICQESLLLPIIVLLICDIPGRFAVANIWYAWKAFVCQHITCQEGLLLPTYDMLGRSAIVNIWCALLLPLPTCDIQWSFAFANIRYARKAWYL